MGESVGVAEMDRVTVEFTATNHHDATLARLGLLDPNQVRRARLRGVVEPGAMRPVLPRSVVDQLGLEVDDPPPGPRSTAKGVSIELFGRDGVYTAFVEPDPAPPILGQIVMEDLDLIVDRDTLAIRPRDPTTITSEAE